MYICSLHLSLWFSQAFGGPALVCLALGVKGKRLSGKKTKRSRDSFSLLFLVLSMLHNPLGNVLGKPPLSFLPLDPLGSDLVDKFPAPSIRGPRLDTRPILDSRSSSPSDSDTSGFSSGSDHLSDLIVCSLLGGRWGGQVSLSRWVAGCEVGRWEARGLLNVGRTKGALCPHSSQ